MKRAYYSLLDSEAKPISRLVDWANVQAPCICSIYRSIQQCVLLCNRYVCNIAYKHNYFNDQINIYLRRPKYKTISGQSIHQVIVWSLNLATNIGVISFSARMEVVLHSVERFFTVAESYSMRTYTCFHIHSSMRICANITLTCTRICMHAHGHTRMLPHACVLVHASVSAHMHAHACFRMHACWCTQACACTHMHTPMCIYLCVLTDVRTSVCTHRHTHRFFKFLYTFIERRLGYYIDERRAHQAWLKIETPLRAAT